MKITNSFKNIPFQKLKKPMLAFFGIILIFVVVVIIFISPITKYLIERYDEKYTGRQITMSWAYINPFTGYFYFSNFKLYESKSDSVFISAKGVSMHISLLKILSKKYEISKLTLTHPRGIIIQNKMDFNYADLVKKFYSTENRDTTQAPIHFNILNVKIIDGEFYYREKSIPVNYFIKKVNFESKGKRWDVDTVAARFSLVSGIKTGDMKGNFTINLKSMDYRFAVLVKKFDLNIIDQFLKDLTNYGTFTANLDADIKAKGNIKDQENLTATGRVAINHFHFGKNPRDDYASFDKLVLVMKEASPKKHSYLIDSVLLNRPYFKYERYDYLDNLQTMFGKGGSNLTAAKADAYTFNLVIEIANYVEVLAKNFFKSYYKINHLAVYNGDIKFNDYALSEKFSMDLNPLNVVANAIDKNNKRVNVSFTSGIKPYGNAIVSLSINPKESSDFEMQYYFQKLSLAIFNPYTITYTSFPLDRGTIEFKGSWNVRNGIIQSDNHVLLIDPRVSKRIKNKENQWIPMPLIMAFVRERGNVIDYAIPISGSLKDPKFHLRDAIFDLLKNIFVKPATIPYGIQVKNVEAKIEKALTFKWLMRANEPQPNQEKFIERVVEFLAKNPKALITISPQYYAGKEKEYILFFEAKKKYFLLLNNKNAQSFSEDDAKTVDKMSVKDSLFVRYLNKIQNNATLFTIQEKCMTLVGAGTVNTKYAALNQARQSNFLAYFKGDGVEKQVRVYTGAEIVPYDGFSFYRITYTGEFPESLLKAYQQIEELNEEAPRKKFKKERKKNRN